MSSPQSQSELDSGSAILDDKEDSYFNEIRNFIGGSGQRQASPELSEEGLNSGQFDEEKTLMPSQDGEEAEELGIRAEEELHNDAESKCDNEAAPGALDDDIIHSENEFEEGNEAELSFSTFPRRYEEDDEQSGFSALEHIRRISDAHQMEESDFGDGPAAFTPPELSEGTKQPLYRHSKSQAYAMMLSLADKEALHTPGNMWHSLARAAAETSAIQSLSQV